MQIHSGGLLKATPHFVKTAMSHGSRGVSRSTFAVFMQPDVEEAMDIPPGGLCFHLLNLVLMYIYTSVYRYLSAHYNSLTY